MTSSEDDKLANAIFRRFDSKRDGFIDAQQLSNVLVNISDGAFTPSQVDDLLRAADLDRDGKLKYEEFTAWICCDGEMRRSVVRAADFGSLKAGLAALEKLDRRSLSELKAYAEPPEYVLNVMCAVMILMKKDPTWAAAKTELNNVSFVDTLKSFDPDSIAPDILSKLEPYFETPTSSPTPGAEQLRGAAYLCQWVYAMKLHGEACCKQRRSAGGCDRVEKAAVKSIDLQVNYLSGEVAFGPEAVPESMSVQEVKGTFDPGDVKDLSLGDRILHDEDILVDLELPPERIFLTACKVPEHVLRARAANALLDKIKEDHKREVQVLLRPTDIILLAYMAAFLALSVVQGEAAAVEQIGICPYAGDSRDVHTYRLNKEEVAVTMRNYKPWAEMGKPFAMSIHNALRMVDHFLLQEQFLKGGDAVEDLKRLMSIPHFTPQCARKASIAAEKTVEWLEVSVRPLL